MSSGSFTNARYERDNGETYSVRCQPETLAAVLGGETNAGSGSDLTSTSRHTLNLNHRRRKPFAARYVSVRFTSTLPTGYAANSILRIPVMQPGVFDAIVEGETTGTYFGAGIRVVGKVRES